MKYNLIQYGCDCCGNLTPVLDADQPLPKGCISITRFTHLCPNCKNERERFRNHKK